MTHLTMFMYPAPRAECEPGQHTAQGLAAYVTATVVYALSGATLFLLATFVRVI